MTNYQIAKHDSNKLIVTEAKSNPLSVAKIPSFKDNIDKLEANNNEVEKLKVLQGKDTTGVTADKDVTTENLITQTEQIAGAAHAYGNENNNNTLMAEVDYSEAKLDSLSAAELITAAGVVFAAASTIPPDELAKKGFSAADLTAYGVLIERFKSVNSSPREVTIDHSGYTAQIRQWMAKSQSLLKNSIDKLAVQFKTKDPEFYKKYKAARHVIVKSASKPADTTTGTTPAK